MNINEIKAFLDACASGQTIERRVPSLDADAAYAWQPVGSPVRFHEFERYRAGNSEVDAPRIVVFTGSGISAESGIPTFRDAGGFWEQFRIEDVCTAGAWKRDPGKLTEFYNGIRKKVREAQPNAAHLAIARLERLFPDLRIITQNVDDLHERAGSGNVLHLHGEIMKLR